MDFPLPLADSDDSSRSADGVLLVEVGGTYLRAALGGVTGPGPGRRELTPSGHHLDGPADDVLQRSVAALAALGRATCGGAAPRRAAVAWPGPLSPAGVVYASPTVAGRTSGPVAVAELLSAAWDGAEVVLLNDLTAAGLRMREAGMADFAVITVGSGIGHKVFAAGQPLLGPAGRGGELGHLVVVDGPDAEACDCGGIGHLGSHGSGRAIVRRVLTRWANNLATAPWAEAVAASADPDAEGGRAILAALADGDPVASAVIGEAAALLGRALAGLYLGVGVERFVLVGGFARAAGEPYRQLVATAAAASCWDLGVDWDAAITVDELDDETGLVGVWLHARDLGWL